MTGSRDLLLTQCLSKIIEHLHGVKVSDDHNVDLKSRIISAYRGVFHDKYVSNSDDIIAEEVSELNEGFPFHEFLSTHHCCWIDFIGFDSFSESEASQIFFSTVSMDKGDSEKRQLFIREYGELLRQGWPVDILVQLFFQDIGDTRAGDARDVGTLRDKLSQIKEHGLLISFGEPIRARSEDITATYIPCAPVEDPSQLCFDDIRKRSLSCEILDFLRTLVKDGDAASTAGPSPLLKNVVTLNRSLHDRIRYLYFLPVNGADQAIGLYCYGAEEELAPQEIQDLSILSYNILFPFISAYKAACNTETIIRESIISSISSIMARNLSHNMGSHVMSSLTNPLESTFRNPEDAPYKEHLFSLSEKDQDAFHQMSYLITYLRFRMDYISDISFRPPSLLVSRSFLSQILAELDRTRLLLNHISGLGRNFVYRFDFVNNTGKQSGRKNDVDIAVPNDVVGTQALYNLAENVIRNVAKHSNSNLKENVFTFAFSEPSETGADGMYEVLLYHNEEKTEKEAEKLVGLLEAYLDRDVIENGTKRREALGMIEMKAAAAFLRQESINTVSKKYSCSPRLLEAVKIPSGHDGMFMVAYRFYLLKPRDFVRICKDGCAAETEGACMELSALRKRLLGGQILNHDFLVYDDELHESMQELKQRFGTALPLRLLRVGDFNGRPVTGGNCWKAWEGLHDSEWPVSSFANDFTPAADPEKYAIILSHDGKTGNSSDKSASEGNPFRTLIQDHREIAYLEGLSSRAASRLPHFSEAGNLTSYVGKLKFGELLKSPDYCMCREMANTSVFVVDERIQDAAYEREYYDVPLMEHYRLAGITVPAREQVDLRATEFNALLRDYLLAIIDEQAESNDFVLIHFGILERIFKSMETRRKDWRSLMVQKVDDWAARTNVVLESGRGVPANLPDSVRFISNSSIFSALVEEKSKMMLNILLYSSRRAVL